MHQSSFDKMKDFVHRYLDLKRDEPLLILDIGSRNINGTYRELFNSPAWFYIGLDIEPGENVNCVIPDPYTWTMVSSNSIDVIISGQAFEHIEYIWQTMQEISRVLKTGGICCIIAPSAGIEHRYPIDCWRIYPDGFRALAQYGGLKVVEVYTQWENQNYPDGSDMWHDSVLIARKE